MTRLTVRYLGLVTACAAATIWCSAASAAVIGAINSFEEIKSPSGGASTSQTTRIQESGPVSHHYPTFITVYNTSGYVNPATHAIGGFAVADTTPQQGVIGPGGIPPTWENDRLASQLDGRFQDQLVIGAGSTQLAPGTPVQLRVTLHLDGRVDFGGFLRDPGGTSSRTDMGARFRMIDPAVTVPNEEGGPPISPPLVDFAASILAQKGSIAPNGFNPDGSSYESYRYGWNLRPNIGDDLDGSFQSESSGGYPVGGAAPGEPGPVTGYTFSTGHLSVLIQTYIGASIDIDGSLNLLTQSRPEAPYAKLDFVDTFATTMQPAAGYEGIELRFESAASVPEPGILGLLLPLVLSASTRRRRRGIN
jgi:hypothetical protein